jgi:hypothetical protein
LRGPAGVGFGDNGFEDLGGLLEIPGFTVTGSLEVGIWADDVMRTTYGLEAFGGTDGPIDVFLSESPDNDNALEEIDLTGFTRLRRLEIGSSFPNVHAIVAPDLTRIGFLELRGLDGLTDLSGFSALEEASTVRIGCGDVSGGGFTSLAGLESLAVAPQLIVAASPNLLSLDALSTTLGTEHLAIINNALLPGTDADAYAAAVGSANPVICGNLGQPSCPWYDCGAGE